MGGYNTYYSSGKGEGQVNSCPSPSIVYCSDYIKGISNSLFIAGHNLIWIKEIQIGLNNKNWIKIHSDDWNISMNFLIVKISVKTNHFYLRIISESSEPLVKRVAVKEIECDCEDNGVGGGSTSLINDYALLHSHKTKWVSSLPLQTSWSVMYKVKEVSNNNILNVTTGTDEHGHIGLMKIVIKDDSYLFDVEVFQSWHLSTKSKLTLQILVNGIPKLQFAAWGDNDTNIRFPLDSFGLKKGDKIWTRWKTGAGNRVGGKLKLYSSPFNDYENIDNLHTIGGYFRVSTRAKK